uniref:Glycosyltransferase family 92 protein n=1 Tax=Cyprinus carpio carpio TaxID=630221 RepID=A0A9J8ANB9_CYPCA
MEKGKVLLSLLIVNIIGILVLVHMNSHTYYIQAPETIKVLPSNNKFKIPEASFLITPIKDSKHFMVSAFIDHRLDGVIRVISIINRNSLQPLYCVYCSAEQVCRTVHTEVQIHRDHFSFPYGASDVICKGKHKQNATHVIITTDKKDSADLKMEYLPIKNKAVQETFKFNFTVCISNLFGDYNNVLQFAQTMEMYKLLGVQHVVIYKTGCGPDLEKLLKHYETEGILEIVPWPIDHFLNPASGWNIKHHKGDIQYYGQLVTLNECIYRHMYQSKYVLLNDIDEIIMPYKHTSLPSLMEDLQSAHPSIGVFLIENHIFPKTQFEESGKFKRGEWNNIPGVNIMEHMYQSKYVLLNDIDEIIMPYKHTSLPSLMEDLQSAHPSIGVFLIENHIFPKTQFEESGKFKRGEWNNIPGVNIMEHIYREPSRKNIYNPTKMIVNPRKVEQTSVHSSLKNFGGSFHVPFNVCRIVHVRVPLQGHLTKEQLFVDKRVWDFEQELIQIVDQTLKLSGFLKASI